jgi:hypothetical protein
MDCKKRMPNAITLQRAEKCIANNPTQQDWPTQTESSSQRKAMQTFNIKTYFLLRNCSLVMTTTQPTISTN